MAQLSTSPLACGHGSPTDCQVCPSSVERYSTDLPSPSAPPVGCPRNSRYALWPPRASWTPNPGVVPKVAGVQLVDPIADVSTCTSHQDGQPEWLDVTRITLPLSVSRAIAPPGCGVHDLPPSVVIKNACGPNTYPVSAVAKRIFDTHG